MTKCDFTNAKTIFGMAHAMMGGLALAGPLQPLKFGYLPHPLACILVGIISASTAILLLKHRGHSSNINQALQLHFNSFKAPKFIFDIGVIIIMAGSAILYFSYAILQLQGLFPEYNQIPYAFFFIYILIILLIRYFEVAASSISLGFISMFSFGIFLIWATVTAPQGDKVLEPIQSADFISPISMVTFSLACQQIVISYPIESGVKEKDFIKVTLFSYALAVIINSLFFLSAFSLVNRTPRIETPMTIQDYFSYDTWQIQFIQIIFLLHILTVGPFYTLTLTYYVGLFCNKQSTKRDIIIIFLIVLLALVLNVTKFPLSQLIELSGSVGACFYAILIPIFMHVKCKYFSFPDEELMVNNLDNSQGQQVDKNHCTCSKAQSITIVNIFQLLWWLLCIIIAFIATIKACSDILS